MSTATAEANGSQTEQLYEGMFLLDSGKFAADPDKLTGQILAILQKAGATVVAHRPWQDGKLAYVIEGHRKGLHYLVLFRMATDAMPDVLRACKLNETVLRQMILRHPQKLFDAMVAAVSPVVETEVADDAPAAAEKTDSDEGGAADDKSSSDDT